MLVVGASASGTQIASEIHRSGRPVTLSLGEHIRVPRVYRDKDIKWWMDTSGVLDEFYTEVDNLDRVRGVPSLQLAADLEEIIRPLRRVAHDQPATRLLNEFSRDYVHMAIVEDADKNVIGLVTLEDIVEELVGELEDEFDRLPERADQLRSGAWLLGGGLTLKEVADKLEIAMPDQDRTLSDWLIEKLDDNFKPGRQHRHGNHTFTVRRSRRSKIFEIAYRPTPA